MSIYAVREFGKIDVSTISPTERGAMIRWLQGRLRSVNPCDDTDEEVVKNFRYLAHRDAQLIRVIVTEEAP